MSALRVALYCEGSAERAGESTLPPAPGDPLDETELGAAHLLFRRVLASESGVASAAIQFDSPLRLGRARIPRGSDLLVRANLRKLLTWPVPTRRPDLVIVLVDADGEPQRKRILEGYVEDLAVPHVIGVAIEEFEAWLLADVAVLRELAGSEPRPIQPSPSPDRMAPREAKRLIREWTSEAAQRGAKTANQLRREISDRCSLDRLSVQPSFAQFREDCRAVIRPLLARRPAR